LKSTHTQSLSGQVNTERGRGGRAKSTQSNTLWLGAPALTVCGHTYKEFVAEDWSECRGCECRPAPH